MKKIFTLIMTALLTLGAYAQTTDVVELSGVTLDTLNSVKPQFVFKGTTITIDLNRQPQVVDYLPWKKGFHIMPNDVGKILLPEGVKLYKIEIFAYSQTDNWNYLLGWGAGNISVNGGNFEEVDSIGANVKSNDVIRKDAWFPIAPCEEANEEEDIPDNLIMSKSFFEDPYEGSFSFTFSGNSQCSVMFKLYLSKESAEYTPTAINSLKEKFVEGVKYNVAGQVVDENYKGIVILNGKKIIQK